MADRTAHVIHFQDKSRYHLQEWKKTEGSTALFLRTLFKDNLFDKLHLRGKTLKDFGIGSAGAIVFQPTTAGISSKAKVEAGEVLHDSLAMHSASEDRTALATMEEKRYLKHTAAALELKRQREFTYFKFHEHQKTLFLFNKKDVKIKYKYVLKNADLFVNTKRALNELALNIADSTVTLPSGGIVFVAFSVRVTPHYGELIFEKCSTDESSENEQVEEEEQLVYLEEEEKEDI